jgi:ArsR family transcriptional regulator
MPQKKCLKCINSLSVTTRLRIVGLLKQKPQNVSQIEAKFNLTQPTISYHLKFLKELGILKEKKRGREKYYFLNKKYPCKNCIIKKI